MGNVDLFYVTPDTTNINSTYLTPEEEPGNLQDYPANIRGLLKCSPPFNGHFWPRLLQELEERPGENVDCQDDISWEVSFRDSSRFWVQYVLFPIVVIIGVMGNAVTIYILTRKPMRSSTNVYLTALAVSDLLYLLFSFSMSWRHFPIVNTIWFYWWYSPIGLWITDASSSTSVWLTVSFTVERYIAVCHPMRREIYCTEQRALFVSVAVYMICFALTASTPFEWNAAIAANQTGALNETIYTLEITDFGNSFTYRVFYHWFTTIVFVIVPLVVLGILNFFLIRAVRKSLLARMYMMNEAISSVLRLQAHRLENRITLILIAVVICFLICQLPTAAVLIYTSFHIPDRSSPEESILLGLGNIFNLLVAINAASNFVLYNFCNKYRKRFCALFGFRRREPIDVSIHLFTSSFVFVETKKEVAFRELGQM
ncbi:FMRFamide receptor [Orchesella cincta]|uniref:FMRFamide receptor n=1 Tax=Orchesella cincta TaxID=48709 RepID=A0A1D2MB92_ORCCI|nr:FMRFamide receptor [Orchesella cincta]